MKIEISIKRQHSQKKSPYLQTFSYDGDGNLTIADWLTKANQEEAKSDRIAWECACLEKKCGACAMRVNGFPKLACSSFLKEEQRRGKILLEPLSKFPLVKDLIVDRSSMFEVMKQMNLWLEEKSSSKFSWNEELQYQAGECIQCGCCLEICPNFLAGEKFAGAAAMVNAYRAIEQNTNDEHRDIMKKEYQKKFFNYCGQALSCKNVCPKHLALDEIQARVNHYR